MRSLLGRLSFVHVYNQIRVLGEVAKATATLQDWVSGETYDRVKDLDSLCDEDHCPVSLKLSQPLEQS